MDRPNLAAALFAFLALSCSHDSGGSDPPPNHQPICSPDSSIAVAATPLVLDVLSNDSDPDGDAISLSAVISPGHGTAVANQDGTVTYTAEAGYLGADAFDYRVSDGKGGEASGTVSLTVHVIANDEIWTPTDTMPLPPLAVPDAAGGAIVVWMEVSPGGIDLRAKRMGQWADGGVLVSTIYGSTVAGYMDPAVRAISDGSGGAIVAWTDFLKGTDVDLYAQRLAADGTALWAKGGVPVCAGPGSDPLYVADDHLDLVSDGGGGAIIAWTGGEDSASTIVAQRLDADGAPLWGSCGKTVSGAATGLIEPRLVPDGAGGAVVAWWGMGGAGVGAQRIDADGAPLWGASNVALAGTGYNAVAVSDGAGGAIVAFGAADDIRAQRVTVAGEVLWSASGVALTAATGVQEYPRIAADGAGGAVVAWWDHRGHQYDTSFAPAIYAQRVLADGSVAWTADGVVACGTPVPRTARGIEVIADGKGGAVLAWADLRDGQEDGNVFAQHLDDTGVAAWGANGMHVTDAPGYQGSPSGVSDDAGGAWLFFLDGRTTAWRISGQQVAADGSLP